MSVRLRADHNSDGSSSYLTASLLDDGSLQLEGSDIGGEADRFGRDEYEYFVTVRPPHLQSLRTLLDLSPSQPLLEALEAQWSGQASRTLERLLREADIPVERYTI